MQAYPAPHASAASTPLNLNAIFETARALLDIVSNLQTCYISMVSCVFSLCDCLLPWANYSTTIGWNRACSKPSRRDDR